jgi:acetyl esterase/lipase
MRRGWAFISADFRCLPESTGLDVLADMEAAWSWIVQDLARLTGVQPDTSRMALAGSSGGGWCAIISGVQLSNPKPKASWALYPMAESAAEVRLKPEPARLMSDEALEKVLADIEQRIQQNHVSTGYRIKPDFSDVRTHARAVNIDAMKQSGRYVDHLTGIKKMGEKMNEQGVQKALEGANDELKKLFPLEFGGLSKDTPPLLLMHGTADVIVDEGESVRFVEKAKSMGATVHYWPIQDGPHGFDGMNRDVEDDKFDRNYVELETGKALKQFLEYVEK